MKKELRSIIPFFGLVIFLLTFSFSVKAERIGFKNLSDSSKAGYPRFAPAPFKTGAAYKYSRAIDLGNALNFDGVNDFVTMGAGLTLPESGWTEEMWIYLPVVSLDVRIMGMTVIGGDDMEVRSKRGPFFRVSNGNGLHGGYGYGTGQTQKTFDARNVLTVGAWNHLAQTYDGNRLKAYVNGKMVADIDAPEKPNANPIKYLGQGVVNYYYSFKGSMDEVRIWNRARTAEEIKDNYPKAVAPNNSDLLLYYSFNQGTAGGDNTAVNTLVDNKGAYNATLNNFTLTGASSNFVASLVLVETTANAATNITEGSFTANWLGSSDTRVDNYILEIARDVNFISLVPGYEKLTVPAGTISWEVNGLSPDVIYYYRVKAAVGSATSEGSNIISVKTLVLTGLGNALNFSRKEALIISNGGISFPANRWTEEMWVYIPSDVPETGDPHRSLLANALQVPNPVERGPCIYTFSKTRLHGGYGDGANWKNYTTSKDVLQLGAWNHVAQTFDGTTLKVYVNGVLVESFNLPGRSNTYKILYIGNNKGGGYSHQGFYGNIDEIRIWSSTRSADEIRDNYKINIDKNHPDLLAYYDFNQGISGGNNTAINTLIDNKGAYNATLNNFTKTGATSNFVGDLKLAPPVASQASGITPSLFTAGWAMAAGSSPTPDKYFLDVSTDETFADESKFVSGYRNKNVGNVTEYAVTELNPGTAYYYRLRAGYAAPWLHPSVNSNTIKVKTLQTNNIALAATAVKVYGDAPYQLAVSSSGTGAYTYTITEGDAVSISNTGQVTVLKAGTATLVVKQVADAVYDSAGSVTQTITVQPKGLTVTATAADKEYDGANAAGVTLLVSGTVNRDEVRATAEKATFNNKDVGAGKPVTVTGITLSGAKAGNYVLANTTATSTANITAKPVTVTLSAGDKVYDGAAAAAGEFTVEGKVSGDEVTVIAQSIFFNDANVGANKPVLASGISLKGSAEGNYRLTGTTAAATAAISHKPVRVTFFANNKVYDGNTTASATFNIEGLSAEEPVTVISADVSFSDKNVGVGKTVTAGNFKFSDANYSAINTRAISTGNITAKPVTVTLSAGDKVYDGAAAATGEFTVEGKVLGDEVTVIAKSIFFNDANVGANKPVLASGISLKGSDQGNYRLTGTTAASTANISGKGVTVSINKVADKVYDGNTTASATFNIEGLSAGETLTVISADVGFSDKNVGVGKTVTAGNFKLSDANYSAINTSATSTAAITAKPVTVTLSAGDKVYDGAAAATGEFTVEGKVSGDEVTVIAQSIFFNDANVGANKPVLASGISLKGSDQGNYRLTGTTAASTANISGKGVTVSINKVADKVYDGNTTASATFDIAGLSAGETLTVISADVSFSDKNVGVGKTVTAGNFKLSDANYSAINTSATSTAAITAKPVTVTLSAGDKVYDGAAAAAGEFAVDGKVSGDEVTVIAQSIFFNDANVGANKPVLASGISLKGSDQGNYKLTGTTAAATAAISHKPVRVTFFANNKVYDGNTTAGGTFDIEGLSAGEILTVISADVGFSDKNVGVGKAVTAGNFKFSDANYSAINTRAISTGNITAKPVTVTLSAGDKVYDGAAAAAGEFAVDGKVSGDEVTVIAKSIFFNDANVGANKPVLASGISLKGSDQGNYRLTGTRAESTAAISHKPVRVTFFANNKVYDGNTTAGGTFDIEGLSAEEPVTVISADVSFSDKNVGVGKTVTAGNFKFSDANYSAINTRAISTGNITAKPVTVTLSAGDKVYDGAAAAAGEFTVEGKVSGDEVTVIAQSIFFNDANVGANKPVLASGISLKGSDQGNYRLTGTRAESTAAISHKPVRVTFFANNKVYDGNTTASATFDIEGLSAEETVTVISADVSFSDKNVGVGKAVTAGNFKLSDANYSAINTRAISTAAITAKAVTVTLSAGDKVYDGAAAAAGEFAVDGKVSGDEVTVIAQSIFFNDANVGANKPVLASEISLKGSDQGNYRLTNTTAAATAAISHKPVRVTFFANNKVYDGNTTASATFNIIGLAAGEPVTVISADVSFSDKNVGVGKAVTAGNFKFSDANYSAINTSATSTGNITAKAVTVTLSAGDKVYDGAAAATGEFTVEGKIAGDELTVIAQSIFFNDANVGANKPVLASGISLKGSDQGNYRLINTTAASTANISGKGVTVSINKVAGKVYDGNTTASATFDIEGLSAEEPVTVISADVSFSDKNVGVGKVVTAGNFKLSDANYSAINIRVISTAAITAKPVTVTLSAGDKVYDGAAAAAGEFTVEGKVSGDEVTVIAQSIFFNDANVGANKPVLASGISLKGSAEGNYRLINTTAAATANISQKPVRVIFFANNKVYDGNTTASATFDIAGLSAGETVTVISADVGFSDKNVGVGKAVTAGNFKLSDANYSAINTRAISTGNITAKPVTVTLSAGDKVYDGAASAAGEFTVEGKVSGDEVTVIAQSIFFNDANVGANKPVLASGISLKGSDQGNYRLTGTRAESTAAISHKPVRVTFFANNKVYDGNTTASATFDIAGLSAGETLTVISADVSFSDKNVGVGKAVTAGNFKLSDANYSAINTTATSTGNISPKDLTITADNKAKFPGEDNPPLTAGYSGFVSGENNTNALTVQPLLTTPATKASPPGNYPIEVSGAVAANSNYNIIYNKGTLTISTVVITAVTLTTNTLYANSPTGTLAGRLTASSTDPKAIYTYSLVSGAVDNGKFTINGDKLYTNAVFNYATQSTFTVRIQVSTQSGGMLTKDFILTILYVNGSPTLDAIADQSVCATTDSHTINLSGITPGPEANQTTTLSITGNNKDMFNALSVTQLSGGKGIINYSLKAGVTGSAVVTVTVKDDGGTVNGGADTYSVSFTVNVNPLPVISISTGTGKLRIIRGRTIELTANAPGATAYSWADAKGIANGQSTAKLTVKPTERTVYTVKATSTAGCSDVKQIIIEVGSEYSDVVANNIITPNGDGVNDVWVIENIEQYPNATVKVFDIAGRLVFNQKCYDNKWNGYYNGAVLNEGAYYYVIDFGTDLYKAKGYVTVIN